MLVLVVVMVGAGLAWAACVRDGQTNDWAGIAPLVTQTRTVTGPAKLVALYGKAAGADLNFRIDAGIVLNQAPQVDAGANQTLTLSADANPTVMANLNGTVTDDSLPNPPGTVTVAWSKDSGPGAVTFGTPTAKATTATFSVAGTYVLRLTANDSALSASDTVQVTVNPAGGGGGLPPDPGTVAPPVDPTVATTTYAATRFLYTGSNPIQTGMAPGTIDPKRSAVLRGRVLDQDGQPLPGVILTILDHPEFGQTLSRADGAFDLAVNGGGYLTVNYQRDGYLPAQRQTNVPWQDFVVLPEVRLVARDPVVTTVNLESATTTQVARGSVVRDGDGTRQATLLFPPGVQAQVYNADGSTRSVSSLNVRATEYTVGPNGPQRMPAELPPTVAYTYAIELSTDEGAIKKDGKDVLFDRPVPFYVDNFLNMPVGIQVPVGYYDPARSAWIPAPDGRVIKVLRITNGLVELDTTGSGSADNGVALGVTEAERQQLASLYSAGKTLWRVPLAHLSTYDCNYGTVPVAGSTPPQQPPAQTPDQKNPQDPCSARGSIIGCESQTLGEEIEVVGTPFRLRYASDRTPGRGAANASLPIALSGPTVPSSLQGINLGVTIAGRTFIQTFPPAANQSTTFVWDGRDAYGQELRGQQTVAIHIGYVYDGFYALPPYLAASFGAASGERIPGDIPAREGVTLWQDQQAQVGSWDARAQNLGGWTLTVHHAYDPLGKVLYQGGGAQRSVNGASNMIITTVAGNGTAGFSGDGGPATQAGLDYPYGIAVGADGSLYIADSGSAHVRRASPGLPGFSATNLTIASTDGRELYGFSSEGRHLSTVDTLTGATRYAFAYDSSGRLTSITDAAGNVTTIQRDGNGNPTAIVAPFGQRTALTLDGNGWLASAIGFGYDANGNLTALTPPGRPAHDFTYTPVNLTAAYHPPTVPGGGDTQYGYNLDRQPLSVNRPDGGVIASGYDAGGRLSTLTLPAGAYGYGYNAAGQLASIITPGNLSLSYSYSNALLTGMTWSGAIAGTVGFTYDNDFRVTAITVNGGTPIAYQYDPDSLLVQASDLTLTRRTDNGLVIDTALGQVSDRYTYNGFGEVTGYDARYTTTTALFAVEYTYDQGGRITRKTETVQGVTATYDYGYDATGRLNQVQRNGATVAAYTYDANGNRLSYTGASTINATYDAQDRLLTYGAATAPIRRVRPRRHIPMERGIRPIAHSRDVTVLHRIPMDVIDMPVEIVGVADWMLPKSPLPDRTFPVFFPGWIHPFLLMK